MRNVSSMNRCTSRMCCFVYSGIAYLVDRSRQRSMYLRTEAWWTVRDNVLPQMSFLLAWSFVHLPAIGMRRYLVLHLVQRTDCLANAFRLPMRSGSKWWLMTRAATSDASTA